MKYLYHSIKKLGRFYLFLAFFIYCYLPIKLMQEKKYQITVNSCNINTTDLEKILFAYESLLELFLKLIFYWQKQEVQIKAV